MPDDPVLLTLRALGLGDLLVAVPALRGLRRAMPAHSHLLCTPGELTDIVALTGAVDEVVPVPALGPLHAAPHAPDVAVNLHGPGPQSMRLLDDLEPAHRIGHGGTGWSGPRWPTGVHERERWCQLLEAHGIPADPADQHLDRPSVPSSAPGSVVIHPGAAHGSRRWPLSRFAEVARSLRGLGYDVVVTGGWADRNRARTVGSAAGLPPDAVLAGRMTLVELAALVADAALVICGDTGVAHLSYAYRTPSVIVFGPVPATWCGPPADGPHHALSVDRIRRGDTFADTPDPALLGVGAPAVLTAAQSLLAGHSARAEPVSPPVQRSPAALS